MFLLGLCLYLVLCTIFTISLDEQGHQPRVDRSNPIEMSFPPVVANDLKHKRSQYLEAASVFSTARKRLCTQNGPNGMLNPCDSGVRKAIFLSSEYQAVARIFAVMVVANPDW